MLSAVSNRPPLPPLPPPIVSQLVHLWFSSKEAWPVDEKTLLPRRLELTRYIMWCFLTNDWERLLKDGNTFVFKKPAQFVREGGVMVYLDNAAANFARPEGARSLLREWHNSTFCARKDNMARCGEFDSLDARTSVNGTAIDPLLLGEHYADLLSTVCMFEKGIAERIRAFETDKRESPSRLLARALEERELLDVSVPLTDDDGRWKRFEARIFW